MSEAGVVIAAVLGSFVGLAILVVVVVYIYYRVTTTTCHCDVDMTGKTVIVTGANAGIGYETVRGLAEKGAKVIMACRNPEKAKAAADQLRSEVEGGEIVVRHLDVSKLDSVREFAKEIKSTEDRLDVLINNAGISGMDNKVSEDGLDLTFATNHYGHFLLTNLLLDLLKSSAPSRVVNVSSVWYKRGQIDIERLRSPKTTYRYLQVYADTKLANVLFAQEIAKRYHGNGIAAYSLHPGSVETHILDNHLNCVTSLGYKLLAAFSHKTPKEGAQTSIHCAVAPGIEHVSGLYFNECKVEQMVRRGRDEEKAKQLWELSEELTGLKETA